MTTPRRYSEDEIALILQQAGAAQERAGDVSPTVGAPLGANDGLTLAQLQEIGVEVGIAPEFVERAAVAVESGVLVPTAQRRWFGLPVGVSRTIDFGRAVTDDEWDRIVVTLRETFEARGRVQREGAFRHWSNGNLQALLEPTLTGHRLRLVTRKGNVAPRVFMGVSFLAMSVMMWSTLILQGRGFNAAQIVIPGVFAVAGAFSLLSIGWQLPRWARTRSAQMESIAARMLDANRTLPERSS